jgi:hypothetical protein
MSDDEAQRDSYRVDLKCPSCGRLGTAVVSEEDYPFTDNRRFSVDDVTLGFRVQNAGGAVSEMEIDCSECNVSARPIGPRSVKDFGAAAPDDPQPDDTSLYMKPLWYFRGR